MLWSQLLNERDIPYRLSAVFYTYDGDEPGHIAAAEIPPPDMT
jgi:hypothetical protein